MALTLQVRKRQLVQDAIWDAATDLFAEKGFDETTVDDITQAAGVSRRSFFRYFSSKSDVMSHGMVNYGTELAAAIEACPQSFTLSEVLRETVLQVARTCAARPRTRKTIDIIVKYPSARSAELSRLADVQDVVAAAFARRCGKDAKDDLMPGVLAGLTLHILGVTFQSWFEHNQRDITVTANRVFKILDRLLCEGANPNKRSPAELITPATARR
ncbi:TetR family transcriptional regulator [uncultured Paludibaculum sp.]|uniref:TetR family transcriptional regulator n=1 Tax=uncultured Paludibaculum sp. TaxID=1765020 RepID=UPI002AAADEBE|nr:TetR family transcriptional regulator [uncultured Paludibaculum sp.]